MDNVFLTKEDCCGCGACANICSQKIIEMRRDEEGFLYPEMTDRSLCKDCGLCQSVCPQKHAEGIGSSFRKAYAGWAGDESDVIKSASGGFAAVLSRSFMKSGGVVYGVRFSSDYRYAVYQRAQTIDDMEAFRGSKYCQSQKENVYKLIETDLRAGKKVLFFGTPCDSFAVQRFTHQHDRLFVCSIICHGPTSSIVQDAFCSEIEKAEGGKITDFSLRYKKNGRWKPYYIRATFDNGREYEKPFEKTDYQTAFQYFKRPSCGSCKFRKDAFSGDLLIGDNHSALSTDPDYNPCGASVVFPLTEKGAELCELIKGDFLLREIDLRRATAQQAIHSSIQRNNDRSRFLKLFYERGLHDACREKTIVLDKTKKKIARMPRKIKSAVKSAVKKIIHNG